MHRTDNARTGLVEHEQYRALRDSLQPYGRIALVIGYYTGARKLAPLAKIDDSVLFHDLRRTALTNMIEAGFSEKEAMEISGRKTRAVFDRYHIVSQRRLNQLGERMEAHMRQKDEEGKLMGKDSGQRQNAKIQ